MDNKTFITDLSNIYFVDDDTKKVLQAMCKHADKESILLPDIFTSAQCIQIARDGRNVEQIIKEAHQAKKRRKKDFGLSWG